MTLKNKIRRNQPIEKVNVAVQNQKMVGKFRSKMEQVKTAK